MQDHVGTAPDIGIGRVVRQANQRVIITVFGRAAVGVVRAGAARGTGPYMSAVEIAASAAADVVLQLLGRTKPGAAGGANLLGPRKSDTAVEAIALEVVCNAARSLIFLPPGGLFPEVIAGQRGLGGCIRQPVDGGNRNAAELRRKVVDWVGATVAPVVEDVSRYADCDELFGPERVAVADHRVDSAGCGNDPVVDEHLTAGGLGGNDQGGFGRLLQLLGHGPEAVLVDNGGDKEKPGVTFKGVPRARDLHDHRATNGVTLVRVQMVLVQEVDHPGDRTGEVRAVGVGGDRCHLDRLVGDEERRVGVGRDCDGRRGARGDDGERRLHRELVLAGDDLSVELPTAHVGVRNREFLRDVSRRAVAKVPFVPDVRCGGGAAEGGDRGGEFDVEGWEAGVGVRTDGDAGDGMLIDLVAIVTEPLDDPMPLRGLDHPDVAVGRHGHGSNVPPGPHEVPGVDVLAVDVNVLDLLVDEIGVEVSVAVLLRQVESSLSVGDEPADDRGRAAAVPVREDRVVVDIGITRLEVRPRVFRVRVTLTVRPAVMLASAADVHVLPRRVMVVAADLGDEVPAVRGPRGTVRVAQPVRPAHFGLHAAREVAVRD